MSEFENDDPRAPLRRFIYALLIVASAATSVGRIYHVESSSHRTPFLSANDRSRWSTIRALVDHGTYALDDVIFNASGKRDKDWYSIDLVRHRGRDGQEHYYSSKPPLLATVLAGEYWLVKQLTGASLGEHPFYVGRVMLVLTNVVPWALALLLLSKMVEEIGSTDWGRVLTMTVASWGTYLTTMTVTLNNHLPAAIGVIVASYAWWRIEREEAASWKWYAVAGLGAAWFAANELPALSLFGLLALGVLWKSWRLTFVGFVPAALLIAIAAFGTTYLAHDSLRPPYAHRNEGDNWYDYPGSYWTSGKKTGVDLGEESRAVYAFHAFLGHHGVISLTPIWLLAAAGVAFSLARRDELSKFCAAVAIVTLVCSIFYILRPLEDRNYGGVSCGFRWLFWQIPLWLVPLVPAADWLGGTRFGRFASATLAAVGIFSASYSGQNPWAHPWLFEYWTQLGWIAY